MGFGERLKELREQKGFSQKEFAQKISVSSSAISHFESGKNYPKSTVLFNIMTTLECDANYLFQDYLVSKNSMECTKEEYGIIEQYRSLNAYGKKVVLAVMDAAYQEEREWEGSGDRIRKKMYIPQMDDYRYVINKRPETILVDFSPLNVQADYCIKVVHGGMSDHFRKNDVLLIKKIRVRHNETGLFQINGYIYVAKLFVYEGRVKLVPLDRSLKPTTITAGMHFKILGRVLGKLEGGYNRIK